MKKYKIGDSVKVISNNTFSCNPIGSIGYITEAGDNRYRVKVDGIIRNNNLHTEDELELYEIQKFKKQIQYKIGIDTFERAEANLTKEEILAICKFNIDKYCWRKKGQDKEDFKKIIDYANFAIKQLEK